MKRELTEEEQKLEKLGLERNKKEFKMLKENLEYNQALLAKQEYLRQFDDKWRAFLRKQKKDEDESVIKQIIDAIKNKESLIDTAQKHLTEGVEIRTGTG